MLQLEHSAKLLTLIKLPFGIKTFVLSIFEWPFYTCFTVCLNLPDDFTLILNLGIFSFENTAGLTETVLLNIHKL